MMRICVVALLLASAGCREGTAPANEPPSAQADTRKPVPLLPMMAEHQKREMREHLETVHEIVAALARDDFAAVATATKKIGYSEGEAQMCTRMGAAAPGFTPTAITFHKTADTIAVAARKKDRAGVLAALDATLGTCVGCHAAYKQQIVDEATWSKLTSR